MCIGDSVYLWCLNTTFLTLIPEHHCWKKLEMFPIPSFLLLILLIRYQIHHSMALHHPWNYPLQHYIIENPWHHYTTQNPKYKTRLYCSFVAHSLIFSYFLLALALASTTLLFLSLFSYLILLYILVELGPKPLWLIGISKTPPTLPMLIPAIYDPFQNKDPIVS